MPIVVRPEDIKLSKRKLRKDLLYSIGLEEGLLIDAQEMVLTVIESRLGEEELSSLLGHIQRAP